MLCVRFEQYFKWKWVNIRVNNNNNNNRFLYSAFPNYDQSASQCIITPVIGFRHNSALKVHFLHSLGSIPASRRFIGAHVPTQPQFRSHPTGSPFNTWVESSNVDKVSCWRTKVPCESGNRTRTLSVRVERSLHYTTAPPPPRCVISPSGAATRFAWTTDGGGGGGGGGGGTHCSQIIASS